MDERGVRVVSTDVGDRYVVEALRREGGVLGGEQSGHIILLDRHCTGDGLAAGLLLCGVMVASGTRLADLVAVMPKWSQLKESLPVRSRTIPPELAAAIEKLNAENEGRARVLVRPSGTEQVVRLMVESRDPALARALLTDAVGLVETKLG
ncbi:MAG: phosphoglucosamine mutase, partial [Gaiellales bacterium]